MTTSKTISVSHAAAEFRGVKLGQWVVYWHADDPQAVGLPATIGSFDTEAEALEDADTFRAECCGGEGSLHAYQVVAEGGLVDARQVILGAIETASRKFVLAALVEWNNTTDNDIDAKGDVWVSNPQTGHWLSDAQLAQFAAHLAR